MKLPFFIVGSGRAGTTLLSTILNASGQVFVPPESDFIARAYPYYRNHRKYSLEDYRCIAEFFRLSSQQDGWGMSAARIVSALQVSQPRSFADVNSCIYNAYLSDQGLNDMRWGIKRPVLIASLDRIRSVFPNALIVHLVRDGRDVYVSYKDVHDRGFRWGPSGVVATSLYWVDAVRRIPHRRPPYILEIRYEDLVCAPEATMHNVCEFLGIDYSHRMIEDFSDVAIRRSIISNEHLSTIHGKVFSKIDSNNISKFESVMSAAELRTFDLFAQPLLDRYGYRVGRRSITSAIANLFRPFIYGISRLYNDSRYRYRDFKEYRRAVRAASCTNLG